MNTTHRTMLLIAGFLLTSSVAPAGSNLVVNGHFSDTNELLHGWKYNYEDTGNGLLAENHTHVSVTNEGSMKHALALRANNLILNGSGQGVQVDSDPSPVAPGGRYTLTISAKTMGPDCRILVEGYRWKPGVKPHAYPKLKEMRKCFRSFLVYFDAEKSGTMGGIKIKVYNREGKHLKAILPFRADIAPEKVKALGVLQDADGALVPRVHNYETLSFYPDTIGLRGRYL